MLTALSGCTRQEAVRQQAIAIARRYEDQRRSDRAAEPLAPLRLASVPSIVTAFKPEGEVHNPCGKGSHFCTQFEDFDFRIKAPEYAVGLFLGEDSVFECVLKTQNGDPAGVGAGGLSLYSIEARLVDLRKGQVIASHNFTEPCTQHEHEYLRVEQQLRDWISILRGRSDDPSPSAPPNRWGENLVVGLFVVGIGILITRSMIRGRVR